MYQIVSLSGSNNICIRVPGGCEGTGAPESVAVVAWL